jgi:hypothetical protein
MSVFSKTEMETLLKQKLAITPKTASLLIQAGYNDYRDLRTVSPNQIVQQFEEQLGLTHREAEGYRRGLRRMVWLATQDEPEELAKRYPDWTQKALRARGVWCPEFDSLTGDEIAGRLTDVN